MTRGARHYGPGGGYAFFSGRDGTRGFVTGEFNDTGLIDDVTGLSDADLSGLLTWRDFYHKDYVFIGLLAGGAFYDASGAPSPLVALLDAARARVAAVRAAAAAAEARAPACSAAWSAAAGGEVWCDGEGGGVPRRVLTPAPPGSDASPAVRCACLDGAHQGAQVPGASSIEVYPACDPAARRCRTAPPAAAGG